MYYYLDGILSMLTLDTAVIDCGGVGYLLSISSATYEKLARLSTVNAQGEYIGARAKLYTYYHVREDSAELFGFYDTDECSAFKLLITVSGVGPKGALAILSALGIEKLALAVSNNDAREIARANGVGIKTAQKVIIELKDKLSFSGSSEPFTGGDEGSLASGDAINEAINALTVLGYTKMQASKAVRSVRGAASVEDLIRGALASLAKQ